MGEDKDCPSVASLTTIDHTASTSDMPQTLSNVLHQTLVHLSPAVRWEQDPRSQSNSQDLLPGAPLHTMPPFAMR